MSTNGVHTGVGELTGPGDSDRRSPSGVTVRAAIIGLLVVAGFGWLIPYIQDLRSAADLGLGPINPASILTLILLLGPINAVLLWRWRRSALTRQEILTVYAMVAATAAIASVGYITFVTIMTTASQYFATPENRWGILIQPHIPLWMQLNNEEAIRWLWEGLPEGQPLPWGAWRDPLLVWGADDPKRGACGSHYDICRDEALNHRVEVVRGIMQGECSEILRNFFQKARIEKRDVS